MKLYKSILATAAFAGIFSSCVEDFAELNQAKDAVTQGNASYLFAQAVNMFEPCGYTYWFYNAPMMYSWNQMAIPTDGMTTGILTTSDYGEQGSQYILPLRYVRDIEALRSKMSAAEAASTVGYQSAAQILVIYSALRDADMTGDLQYTEACRAPYGGTLTPAFDRLSDLYALWLKELDECINVFQAPTTQMIASQDVVYKGDVKKWAKLANSLKLRIAVRMIAQNKEEAIKIANEVAAAPCGYINSVEEAALFNKATTYSSQEGGDLQYHWNNGFMVGTAASAPVVNLMVDNLDPRVRFCYSKNEWNSKIVQAYYDRNEEIPSFIEANVEYTVNADGKKQFVSWKGAGEPWVRYYGLPTEFNASLNPDNNWYFYYSRDHKISKIGGGGEKAYVPYSMFNRMLVNGRTYDAYVPTTPEDVKSIAEVDRPWYGLYMGAAEVNLYLAEFAMLQGKEAEAEAFYNNALPLSVQEYDKLCALNQVAYYGTTYDYDPNEKKIDLEAGEIETMMSHDAYKFTGSAAEKMEKIYVQQLLNFTMYPNEQFVTSRRSGYPKFGSTLLPRAEYADAPVNKIPRRFDSNLPAQTDMLYQIKLDALKAQGFTPTSSGAGHSQILHDERIWADVNAPEWGAGHNY